MDPKIRNVYLSEGRKGGGENETILYCGIYLMMSEELVKFKTNSIMLSC
jgi:hypothetical protein